jgi:chorismate dehydratase
MTDMTATGVTAEPRTDPIRIGVVSFLNTLPLIDGLDVLENVELRHTVPSLLIDQLLEGAVELALCSTIDYQRAEEDLVIVPVGLLGCGGATLTVRLYSSVPVDRIERVYCDTDSHTSVALMQIILRERYGVQPDLVEYDAREHVAENRPLDWPGTVLLIGDKVVTDSPPAVRYPHQLDLGAEWADHTGHPFVFAAWMARADADSARIASAAAVLDRQRRANRLRLDSIVHDRAVPRGWPEDLARTYITRRIAYAWERRHEAGLELFFEKAHACGLVPRRRPVRLFAG